VLFYAEGNWTEHLEAFTELPAHSIVFHVDRSDIAQVAKVLGGKFCVSGGLPNTLLGYGTPQQVRDHCKKLIDTLGRDGGYIMDASAIIQNDAQVENIRAMTEFTREYGVYPGAAATLEAPAPTEAEANAQPDIPKTRMAPAVCVPWEDKKKEIPRISGDEGLARRIWEANDALGYVYIWQCLLSF
jgi:hypothetical protein